MYIYCGSVSVEIMSIDGYMTFSDAENNCTAKQKRLLSAYNALQYPHISKLLRNHSMNAAWVDVRMKRSPWHWVSGK